MIIGVTGHRTNKLGGYGARARRVLLEFAIQYLKESDPDCIITGMALGWDQAIARACCTLYIPFIAAIPCLDQDLPWAWESRIEYKDLLAKAYQTVMVCQGYYHSTKMLKRNRWIVDHCDRLDALWSGVNGGTERCVAYARNTGRPVRVIWKDWTEYLKKMEEL